MHSRQCDFLSEGTAGLRLALVSTLREYEPDPPPCSTGHLQNLAIDAWLEFADEVILLVDNDAGCAAARARSPKIICLQHHCQNLEYDKPSMPCLFSSGEAISQSDIIMYTNPDFVYGGVRETVAAVRQHSGNFVIVGRRVSIDAAPLCRRRATMRHTDILRLGHELGQVDPEHAGWAMDYFIFTKYSLPLASMPPFIVGVWRWDNWLFGEVVRLGAAHVVDASDTIAATHIGRTSIGLSERSGAKYNNDLWHAALPGNRPIPKPAGLGDMQFATYFSVHRGSMPYLVRNDTASLLVGEHVEEIRQAAL